MITYENLKKWGKDNKEKIVYGACLVAVFLAGFGTGKADKKYGQDDKQPSKQTNYTTNQVQNKDENENKVLPPPAPLVTPVSAADIAPPSGGECIVKGNATSKIYHVKGGAFYDRLKSPQCFGTEAEAQAAGFRKSNR